MLCLLLPAWFSMNSWIFQPIQVGVAGLTPPGMRGTFYDGESSFPSGINKSPLAFGTFIWASKSHFISHQLQLLPPAQHSCFSLESWVPQRMELLLSLSSREWCGQKFPFPVGKQAGNALDVSSSCSICCSWLEEPPKKIFSFPPPGCKITDVLLLLWVHWIFFGVVGNCVHLLRFWECRRCFLQGWRVQVLQLGRAKLLKIPESAAWEKLFLFWGLTVDSLHILNPIRERFFPHEEQLSPLLFAFLMNAMSKGVFSREKNVNFHHKPWCWNGPS